MIYVSLWRVERYNRKFDFGFFSITQNREYLIEWLHRGQFFNPSESLVILFQALFNINPEQRPDISQILKFEWCIKEDKIK